MKELDELIEASQQFRGVPESGVAPYKMAVLSFSIACTETLPEIAARVAELEALLREAREHLFCCPDHLDDAQLYWMENIEPSLPESVTENRCTVTDCGDCPLRKEGKG